MINILPPELKQEMHYGRLNVVLLGYLYGLIAIALVLIAVVFIGLQLINSKKVSIDNQLAQSSVLLLDYSQTIQEAEKLSKTIQTIRSLLSRDVHFSELITSIAGLVPRGAYLDGISLSNQQDSLKLSAVLDSQQLAAVFQKNLIESELFSVADILNISKISDGRYSGTFNVVFSDEASPLAPQGDSR